MKKLILLMAIVSVAIAARAQDEEEPKRGFDKEKLFFGGNFGLSFGSSYTLVNVSPQAGYRFNKYVAAGAGINFIYTSSKYISFRENYGVAGLNIFGRFYPIEQIFIQAQPEMNYTWGKVKYDGGAQEKLDGKMVPSFLAGGGVAIPMGRKGAMLIMMQYDLLQQSRSPYGNKAFISVGFNF